MTARAGSNFRLAINHPTAGLITLDAAKSDTISWSNEQVDVTKKSLVNSWRNLQAHGNRTGTITSEGIVDDSTILDYINESSTNNTIITAGIKTGPFVIIGYGKYLISSFERNGEYNGVEGYSLTLESAGDLVTYFLPPLTVPTNNGIAVSTRLLSDTYSGPCCRVRRASDNTEIDIDFAADEWRDDSQLASFCSGTQGFLVKWYNQDVTGSDLVQSDNSKQPEATNAAGVPHTDTNGNPTFLGDAQTRGTYMESESAISDLYAKTIASVISNSDPDGDFNEINILCSQEDLANHLVKFTRKDIII